MILNRGKREKQTAFYSIHFIFYVIQLVVALNEREPRKQDEGFSNFCTASWTSRIELSNNTRQPSWDRREPLPDSLSLSSSLLRPPSQHPFHSLSTSLHPQNQNMYTSIPWCSSPSVEEKKCREKTVIYPPFPCSLSLKRFLMLSLYTPWLHTQCIRWWKNRVTEMMMRRTRKVRRRNGEVELKIEGSVEKGKPKVNSNMKGISCRDWNERKSSLCTDDDSLDWRSHQAKRDERSIWQWRRCNIVFHANYTRSYWRSHRQDKKCKISQWILTQKDEAGWDWRDVDGRRGDSCHRWEDMSSNLLRNIILRWQKWLKKRHTRGGVYWLLESCSRVISRNKSKTEKKTESTEILHSMLR